MSTLETEVDTPEPTTASIIYRWWTVALSDRNTSSAKALAARLRRASALEALAEPAVHELAHKLNLKPTPGHTEALLRTVRVLAWVRKHVPATLAKRLGGEPPKLSTLRFQRLMRAEGEDLTTALRRALPLADYDCNVAVLGNDLMHWGDAARTCWSFHYFGAPTPHTETNSSVTEESSS